MNENKNEEIQKSEDLNNVLTAFKNLITNEVSPNDLRKILMGLHFRHTNMITHDEDLQHKDSNDHLYFLSRVIECLDGKIED
jgi:uncharacterized circularly permuted ATP-grasp superfamily protein